MSLVAERTDVHAERRRRADELMTRFPYAREPLALYRAVLDAQEPIFTHALEDAPGVDDLAQYVVRNALPGVVGAVMAAGTEVLRESVLLRFHDGDLETIVTAWLRGESATPSDAFLARAATAPILEAVPDLAASLRGDDEDDRRCPVCGGLPQLASFGDSGESLVTAPRTLVCSRCAAAWAYPRMQCVSCRETNGNLMPILADETRLAHLRIDACDTCHAYLVTVDVRKDRGAVPLVDEIVALPLDLLASERGYRKITPNVMGF